MSARSDRRSQARALSSSACASLVPGAQAWFQAQAAGSGHRQHLGKVSSMVLGTGNSASICIPPHAGAIHQPHVAFRASWRRCSLRSGEGVLWRTCAVLAT